MKTNKQFSIHALVVLALSLFATSVFAQSADERAANYAERAAVAYSDGNLDQAIALYEQAFQFVPDPSFAYNLGAMYSEAGNTAQSYNFFSRYVDLFPGAEDRAEIEAYLDETLPDVQRNFTLVEATSRPEDAEVYMISEDGSETFLGRAPVEWWVEPGSLTFEFRLEGYEPAQVSMRGVPGVRVSPSVRLEEVAAEGTTTSNTTEEGSTADTTGAGEALIDDGPAESGGGSLRTAGFAATGLGVVGIGVGSYLMMEFISARNDVNGTNEPPATREAFQEREDYANSLSVLAPAVLVTGALLTAAGVGLIVTSGGGDTEASASIAPITPETWGLSFSGRF